MKKYTPFLSLGLAIFSILLMTLMACKSPQEAHTSLNKNSKSDMTTFILVRHAEKIQDGSKDPDLTAEGQERAERLKNMLQTVGITAIYSTDYTRTRQTVVPLAEFLNIDIQSYAPQDKAFLDQLTTTQAGGVVLMVGHSNTIPGMVNHLIGEEKYQDLDENDYDNLFLVTISEDRNTKVLHLKF